VNLRTSIRRIDMEAMDWKREKIMTMANCRESMGEIF
jgi:hypothetical protein